MAAEKASFSDEQNEAPSQSYIDGAAIRLGRFVVYATSGLLGEPMRHLLNEQTHITLHHLCSHEVRLDVRSFLEHRVDESVRVVHSKS